LSEALVNGATVVRLYKERYPHCRLLNPLMFHTIGHYIISCGSFDFVVKIPSLAVMCPSLIKLASQGKAYYIFITGTFGVM
jgi:hypothetical protein